MPWIRTTGTGGQTRHALTARRPVLLAQGGGAWGARRTHRSFWLVCAVRNQPPPVPKFRAPELVRPRLVPVETHQPSTRTRTDWTPMDFEKAISGLGLFVLAPAALVVVVLAATGVIPS